MQFIFNNPKLKEKRKTLRKKSTKSEKIFWSKIRGKQIQGLKFRRQYSIGNYIVDFVCIEKKLVIEIDGDSHFIGDAKKYDKERSNFIESKGFKVLRFTNEEVQKNTMGCLERLVTSLESTPPSLPYEERDSYSKAQKKVKNFLKTAKKPLVVIVGSTASGKTSLSIKIAKEFDGEIISADSRQIFRKLDLGTAKVKELEMEGISHYGIDIREPDESFTVAEFKEYAEEKITDILKRKKLPIMAGGTGLYVNAVTQDFSIPRVPADWKLRARLEKLSTKDLHKKLKELDPEEAEKIHPNNRRYVIRAIEIAKTTKQKKSEIMQKQTSEYDVLILGVDVEREVLYDRINKRVDQMFEEGFVEEVQSLITEEYDFKSQAFNSVGYPEVKAMLDGEFTEDEAKELMKKNTRNYAKRQLTWWRGDEQVVWV